MSKRDRIPDQWPALMSDEMSARYLDISLTLFHMLVTAGHIQQGRKLFGTTVVRWRREALDAVINLAFGLPAGKDFLMAAGPDVGDEWMAAINAN